MLCHDGETGDIMARAAQENDILTLVYNGIDNTLAIGFNDEVHVHVIITCSSTMYMYVTILIIIFCCFINFSPPKYSSGTWYLLLVKVLLLLYCVTEY